MRRVLASLALVATLGAAIPAAASHNADLHSQDVALLANFDHGGSYRQGTDLAFWGNLAVLGSFDNPGGFRLVDVSKPARPRLVGQLKCPGSQGDVSIWEDLVFVSVDSARSGPECGAGGASRDQIALGESWEGVRVVSIANPAKPVQLKAVKTDCGSHTHTLVPDLAHREGGKARPRLLVYVESYSAGRQGSNCNAHFKISVLEVPLDRPRDARVIATPSVFPAVGCHDVTVFLPRKLAAAACLTESQIWDLADPVNPRVVAHISNPLVNIHHSTAFSWDGRTVVIGDEVGAAAASVGCLAEGHAPLGALWFYDVTDPANPQQRDSFVIPRNEATVFCTAHNFSAVPLPGGRDVLVSAWYNGGTTLLDFTDPSNVVEIAHYTPKERVKAAAWSSYWYNGFVYVNNFDEGFVVGPGRSRGLDVLRVTNPALAGALRLPRLNPQTQEGLPARAAARPSAPTSQRPRVLGRRAERPLPATGVGAGWGGALVVLGGAAGAAWARRRRD